MAVLYCPDADYSNRVVVPRVEVRGSKPNEYHTCNDVTISMGRVWTSGALYRSKVQILALLGREEPLDW